MNDIIAEGIQNDDILTTCSKPVGVFVTFEDEEGRYRAEHYNELVETPEFKHYNKFLG